MSRQCCACAGEISQTAAFCKHCGVGQNTSPSSSSPSDTVMAEGTRQRLGPGLAAASDRGLRHPSNQDAFWLSGPARGGPGSMAIVCDGVSCSQTPHLASNIAATKGGEAMLRGHTLADAAAEAAKAAATLPCEPVSDLSPPSTTFAAVRVGNSGLSGNVEVSWAWVGDTRIYWLPENLNEHARVLTSSLLHVAENGALLRCLGRESDDRCETGRAVLPKGGRVLLCSDGLWGYDPSMLTCPLRIAKQADCAAACDALVAYALACGGRDNVSAVLVRL